APDRLSFTYFMATPATENASLSPTPKCALQAATPLLRVGTLATFHTVLFFPHGLQKGDAVRVANALRSSDGTPSPQFNGSFTIDSVPDPFSFSYQMSTDPGENACGSPTYQELWQVGQMLVENNVIELSPLSSSNAPTALNFYGSSFVSP